MKNQLIGPEYGPGSFLSLVTALRRWCLGESVPDWIPETNHLVFLLIDGLGDRLLSRLGAGSFLLEHQVDTLTAVYPSTTTVALTTLATGVPPAEHGMPGWWSYLPSRDLSVTPLPFCRRFGKKPLDLDVRELWPLEPWMGDVPVSVLAVSPEEYSDSVFTRYLSGDRKRLGYSRPEDCLDLVKERQKQNDRSFTYLYWPQFDTACHTHGCTDEFTRQVFHRLDDAARELAGALGPESYLLVSADHGLLDIAEENKLILTEDDPLMDCLVAPPTGEPRNPVFHLRPGKEDDFRTAFGKRFEGLFELFSPQELELGGPLSVTARERYGQLVGVAVAPVVLHFRARGDTAQPGFIGYHGGRTPEEMVVPLIRYPRG